MEWRPSEEAITEGGSPAPVKPSGSYGLTNSLTATSGKTLSLKHVAKLLLDV